MDYNVYIVLTVWGRLYTGITTDIPRRINEHNNTKKGAKALRGQIPVKLAWSSSNKMTRSEALKLEYRIKQLSPTKKKRLVAGDLSVLE